MPTSVYAYRCVDRSVVLPVYRRYLVSRVARRLPARLPANLVTLGASTAMWAVLVLVAGGAALPPAWLALTFVVLVQFHEVYDHADGMHAKRTGNSSALGEYLDHALDAYHGQIVVLAIFALLGFGNRALVLLMLWAVQLAFVATMAEERETGELHLGPVGSLEAVMASSAFFLSWTLPPVRAWWLAPLAGGVPAYGLLAVANTAGTGSTVWACARRLGRLPGQLALFGAGGLVLALLLAAGPLPTWAAVASLVLYGGDQTGRIIGSHLLAWPQPWPDLAAPAVAALLVAVPGPPGWAVAALPMALLLRALLGAIAVLVRLRVHWRWVNPPSAPVAAR